MPEVIKQIRGYRSTIKHHEEYLTERYHSVCLTMERLNAMGRQAGKSRDLNSLIQKAAQKRVELRIDPNPRLIVFGFDANQRDGRWKTYLENITHGASAAPDIARDVRLEP
jgi:hypothetical protein